jgi:hypothetical protein
LAIPFSSPTLHGPVGTSVADAAATLCSVTGAGGGAWLHALTKKAAAQPATSCLEFVISIPSYFFLPVMIRQQSNSITTNNREGMPMSSQKLK